MINSAVFVPPLNLSPKPHPLPLLERFLSQKAQGQKSKNIGENLAENASFIREKSIYRCYISKNKLPSKEKSLVHDISQTEASPNLTRVFSSIAVKGEREEQQEDNRERYFKRKNRMNRTLCGGKIRTDQNTVENVEDGSEQGLPEQIMLKSASALTLPRDADLAQLKQQNEQISRENTELRRKLRQSEARIVELSARVEALEQAKQKLERQLQAVAERVSSGVEEEAQLREQLAAKERALRQVQSGYKYLEIENTMLLHAKAQCSGQRAAIDHLEREKRVLEGKVQLLYELTRRGRRRGRVDSDVSLSLSLSLDTEEPDPPALAKPARQPRHSPSAPRVI